MLHRQRHLKCDEAKPNCRRCLRDGKVCQGYPSIRTLNFEILSNAKEMRSYHYFNEQVAAGLSGQYNWVSLMSLLNALTTKMCSLVPAAKTVWGLDRNFGR